MSDATDWSRDGSRDGSQSGSQSGSAGFEVVGRAVLVQGGVCAEASRRRLSLMTHMQVLLLWLMRRRWLRGVDRGVQHVMLAGSAMLSQSHRQAAGEERCGAASWASLAGSGRARWVAVFVADPPHYLPRGWRHVQRCAGSGSS